MMVSFGNASGPLEPCNVTKSLAPKGLYLTRPSIAHYTSTREELDEAAKKVFEMFISKKFKLDIFKKYSLSEIIKAHQDLEGRKILGPAIIVP
jgi:NADPH2:quinone reductase